MNKLYRWMQVILLCEVLMLGMVTTTACTSNQFHTTLNMAQSGANYVAIVIGHPEIQVAINAAFTTTGAVYDSWVSGKSTADSVQAALKTLASQLTGILDPFHITDAKTVGLIQLTIQEVLSLVALIPMAQPAVLHHAMKAPSAAEAKAVSPQFKTPAEFKAAFNLAAGVNVIK